MSALTEVSHLLRLLIAESDNAIRRRSLSCMNISRLIVSHRVNYISYLFLKTSRRTLEPLLRFNVESYRNNANGYNNNGWARDTIECPVVKIKPLRVQIRDAGYRKSP